MAESLASMFVESISGAAICCDLGGFEPLIASLAVESFSSLALWGAGGRTGGPAGALGGPAGALGGPAGATGGPAGVLDANTGTLGADGTVRFTTGVGLGGVFAFSFSARSLLTSCALFTKAPKGNFGLTAWAASEASAFCSLDDFF